MSAPAFAEHAAVRTTARVGSAEATTLPPGSRDTIVDVCSTPPDQEHEYTVQLIIVDGRGVQVDAWLIDVKHSQLTLVVDAKEATPIRRLSEALVCAACLGGHFKTGHQWTAKPATTGIAAETR